MYTKATRPGKFEGNRSQMLAEAVYDASLNGPDREAGDVSELGWWAGMVVGKRYTFIITEDNDGFVDVETFRNGDRAIETNWNTFERMEIEAGK
jgi:hypothetical protein